MSEGSEGSANLAPRDLRMKRRRFMELLRGLSGIDVLAPKSDRRYSLSGGLLGAGYGRGRNSSGGCGLGRVKNRRVGIKPAPWTLCAATRFFPLSPLRGIVAMLDRGIPLTFRQLSFFRVVHEPTASCPTRRINLTARDRR